MQSMLPEYMKEYLDSLIEKGYQKNTVKQYSSDLQKFLNWLNNSKGSIAINTLQSLTDHDLNDYVKYLYDTQVSDATFRRLLSVLNQFLKYLNINDSCIFDKAKERPLRPLNDNDFISDNDMNKLLISMRKANNSTARDFLIDRNLAIVCLVRYYGLTPNDISNITMDMINFAQKTIEIKTNETPLIIELTEEHVQYIRDYRNSIDEKIRPRLRSLDPLFVSFFNLTYSYRFDYAAGKPKALSIRGIQEMIKDEIKLAGLRKMSAKHLRNSCIIDHLSKGLSNQDVITKFQLSDFFSLRRYKEYLKEKLEIEISKVIE
ncbi:site-specific integrase [Robertmurraya korlensis]|uniref:tyrosine-type recombinase/integrase n=1 Tax=Robertmurraya korlensis TaxID=519977 RepID=UPI002042013B|nr:site-specific integrase [Robertmurraya korlensis]MCM3603154.1 site-specific integrase [Robertmurraya korlensis]